MPDIFWHEFAHAIVKACAPHFTATDSRVKLLFRDCQTIPIIQVLGQNYQIPDRKELPAAGETTQQNPIVMPRPSASTSTKSIS